ncbi:hypothetical protein [Bosea vaviloviae]|uniref:Uncharacterized protein n=1 Tax=Bosea vaviloviae TaxID=1526658 RepID=A0A1D7TVX1_9HYPH|nr:hypothetical protein [Bosea vaviloviae]AOO79261.1 hypothetical protein BHK69_01015 [Bosea vaviloviae]
MQPEDKKDEDVVEIDVNELKEILAGVDRVTVPRNLRERLAQQDDPAKVKAEISLNFRSNIAWQ